MASSVRVAMSKREDAVLYKGHEQTYNKALELMEQYGLPRQLLMPLRDVEEGGGVEATGDIWLKQKKPRKHYFKKCSSHVSYAEEISCTLERNKMGNIKGVKAKKTVPVYMPLFEIVVNENSQPPTIAFKTYGGIQITYPLTDFTEEEFPADEVAK